MSVSTDNGLHGLTKKQRDLLIALAGMGPTSGVELREHVQEQAGYEISNGTLYPVMTGFEEAGLVDAKRGSINQYELTLMGRNMVWRYYAWVADMVRESK